MPALVPDVPRIERVLDIFIGRKTATATRRHQLGVRKRAQQLRTVRHRVDVANVLAQPVNDLDHQARLASFYRLGIGRQHDRTRDVLNRFQPALAIMNPVVMPRGNLVIVARQLVKPRLARGKRADSDISTGRLARPKRRFVFKIDGGEWGNRTPGEGFADLCHQNSVTESTISFGAECRRSASDRPLSDDASSTKRHSALAKRIWSGVRQRAFCSSGLQTRITRPWALEAATFRRFRLKRKSMPRGASSTDEVAIE